MIIPLMKTKCHIVGIHALSNRDAVHQIPVTDQATCQDKRSNDENRTVIDGDDQIGDQQEHTFANIEILSRTSYDPKRISTVTPSLSLTDALSSKSVHLKVLHININCTTSSSSSIALELCRGLARNSTIETVEYKLSKSDRTPQIALAWCAVLQSPRSAMTTLHIHRSDGSLAPTQRAPWPPLSKNHSADGYNNDNQQQQRASSDIHPCDNAFACILFQGLSRNERMQKFRLQSYVRLCNITKEHFYEQMEANHALRHVYVEFEERDYRLSLFAAVNIGRWRNRLSFLSRDNRVDLITILQEVSSLKTVDPVESIFYLIRRSPHSLLIS